MMRVMLYEAAQSIARGLCPFANSVKMRETIAAEGVPN
jgi:hypothetical protein